MVGSMNVSSCTLKTTIYVYALAKQAIGYLYTPFETVVHMYEKGAP